MQSIHKLLTPSDAKYFASPFEVGTDKVLVYGQVLSMAARSELISTIPATTDIIPVATSITLTEINLPAFVYVWLMMNGLTIWTNHRGEDLFSLKDLLLIQEWIAYFGIDTNTEEINIMQYDIDHKIQERFNAKQVFDDEEKALISKIFKTRLNVCLNSENRTEAGDACGRLKPLADALGIDLNANEEYKLASVNYQNPTTLMNVLTGLKATRPLTPIELKWGNKAFDSIIESIRLSTNDWVKGDYYRRLEQLGPIIGRASTE